MGDEVKIVLDKSDINRIGKHLDKGKNNIDDILMEICHQGNYEKEEGDK